MSLQSKEVNLVIVTGIVLVALAFIAGLGGLWYWALVDNDAGEVVFAGLFSALALGTTGVILIEG